jgi:hypothetical protein
MANSPSTRKARGRMKDINFPLTIQREDEKLSNIVQTAYDTPHHRMRNAKLQALNGPKVDHKHGSVRASESAGCLHLVEEV